MRKAEVGATLVASAGNTDIVTPLIPTLARAYARTCPVGVRDDGVWCLVLCITLTTRVLHQTPNTCQTRVCNRCLVFGALHYSHIASHSFLTAEEIGAYSRTCPHPGT